VIPIARVPGNPSPAKRHSISDLILAQPVAPEFTSASRVGEIRSLVAAQSGAGTPD